MPIRPAAGVPVQHPHGAIGDRIKGTGLRVVKTLLACVWAKSFRAQIRQSHTGRLQLLNFEQLSLLIGWDRFVGGQPQGDQL